MKLNKYLPVYMHSNNEVFHSNHLCFTLLKEERDTPDPSQCHLSLRDGAPDHPIFISDYFRGSMYTKKLYVFLWIILLKGHRKCVKLSNSAASTLLLNTNSWTILFEELKLRSWTVKTQRRKSVWEDQFKQATGTSQRDAHFSQSFQRKTNEDVSHYTYSRKSAA